MFDTRPAEQVNKKQVFVPLQHDIAASSPVVPPPPHFSLSVFIVGKSIHTGDKIQESAAFKKSLSPSHGYTETKDQQRSMQKRHQQFK